MTDSDREPGLNKTWMKVRECLKAEAPDVVYDKRLKPLTFVETKGSVVRLTCPSSVRDWVANTYRARILELWREEDDSITELEIAVEPDADSAPARDREQQEEQRRATAAKQKERWAAAIQSARERGPIETQIDTDPVRKQLGKVGVWSRTPYMGSADKATTMAAAAEELGYPALWIPGFDGGHIFERCGMALAATENLTIATGIVNIWRHEPSEAAQESNKLRADSGDRFLLGLGGSHRELIGDDYDKVSPLAKMRSYLAELDAAGLPAERRFLGALGPKMLELSAERSLGAHPLLITPEYTAAARVIFGEQPLLMPYLPVILENDPAKARAIAREFVGLFLGGPNYANNMYRLGYTVEDFTAQGGDISDRLIDDLIAWGDANTIAAKVRAHLDAGADHVSLMSLEPESEVDVWRELAPAVLN